MADDVEIKGPGYGFDYSSGRTKLLEAKRERAAKAGNGTTWASRQAEKENGENGRKS
jgi:hypothetical protein